MPMPDGYLVSTLRRQSQTSAPGPSSAGQYLSPNYTPQPTIVWNGAAQAAETAKQRQDTDFAPGPSLSPTPSVASSRSASSKREKRNSGPPPSRSSRLVRPAGWGEVISPIEERTESGSTAEHAKNVPATGQR